MKLRTWTCDDPGAGRPVGAVDGTSEIVDALR